MVAINGIKGTLVSSTNNTHKGYPGLEFQASLEGALYTSRIYLVNARLYQMVVIAATGKVASRDINRYLTSFDLKTDQSLVYCARISSNTSARRLTTSSKVRPARSN